MEEFDMFSSSSAPRRQTEMSTRVTWIDSESRVPYWRTRKLEVKHSVENLVVTSSSEDADVDVQNATRQQDSSVKTDKQDSEMSLAAENDDRTTTQLTEGQRGNSIDETRVTEDFRRQHVDKIRLQDLEYGEVEVVQVKKKTWTRMKRMRTWKQKYP